MGNMHIATAIGSSDATTVLKTNSRIIIERGIPIISALI